MAGELAKIAGNGVTMRVRKAPRDWWRILFYVICGIIFFYMIFPVLVIAPMSFSSAKFLEFPPPGLSLQWYANYFGSEAWIDATKNSIIVAIMTTVFATVIGTLASFGIARGHFAGKDAVYALAISPMIIPSIIMAISIYALYAKAHLIGNVFGLSLAHTVMALPFVVVNVSATLKGFDRALERAAANLGANSMRTMWNVTLPIIQPGVVAGALFAFITSFDEVIIAIFIAGRTASTLPKKMWEAVRLEIDPTISAVSMCLIVLSLLILATQEVLRRRTERIRGTTRPS